MLKQLSQGIVVNWKKQMFPSKLALFRQYGRITLKQTERLWELQTNLYSFKHELTDCMHKVKTAATISIKQLMFSFSYTFKKKFH